MKYPSHTEYGSYPNPAVRLADGWTQDTLSANFRKSKVDYFDALWGG